MTRTVSAFQSPSNNVATECYPVTSGNLAAGELTYYNSDGTIGEIPLTSIAGINPSANNVAAQQAFGYEALVGNRQALSNVYGGSIGKNVTACTGPGSIPAHLIAYMDRNLGQAYFTILDATLLTPIVAPITNPTSLSAVFIDTVNANICATTLTGGNVVIVWTNSAGGTANRVNYAIVNPTTGAIVTAATQDTAAAVNVTGTIAMKVVPISSTGGFAIAFNGPANTLYLRGYGPTGTATFAWQNLTGIGNFNFGLAANTSTILLTGPSTTANNVAYAVYNHSGVLQGVASTFTSQIGTGTMSAVDAAYYWSTDEYVIGYCATGAASVIYPSWRRFNATTGSLSSEYYVPNASTNMLNAGTTGSLTTVMNVTALPSPYTTFILGFASSTSQAASYAVFDFATNGCVSGTYGTVGTTSPINTAAVAHTNQNAYVGPAALGAYVLSSNGLGGYLLTWYTSTNTTSALVRGISYAQIDPTSYVMTQSQAGAVPKNVNNVFGTATGYSMANSTPTQASFAFAAGSAYYTPTIGAVSLAPTVVDSFPAAGLATCTAVGAYTIVVLARNTGQMRVLVYDSAYALVNTWTLADLNFFTAHTTYLNQCVKVAAIPNANYVVIAYATSATNVRTILLDYTTGLTAGATVNITVTSMAMTTNSTTFDVAGLPINGNATPRYVIAYNSSTGSRLAYQVLNGLTNASIVAETLVSAAATTTAAVGAFATGGFLVACRDTTTTTSQIYTYANPTGNTFTQVLGATNLSGVAAIVDNRYVASTSNGYVITSDIPAATSARGYVYAINGSIATNYDLTLATPNAHFAVGFSGLDAPVIFGHASGSPFAASQRTSTLFGALGNATTTLATSFSNAADVNTIPAIASGFGTHYFVVYRNSFYQPVIAAASGAAISDFTTLAGTESSTGIPIYASTTATSPAIANTILLGVALSPANSGSDVVVQVGGEAELNSNYPATPITRAFDYTKQGVPGVRGTITGRKVNLRRDT